MMKKNFKIITLLLSCLLLIGAAVGFSVSASGEATVSIAKKSLQYTGATNILYAIEADNLASGDVIKVAFSYEEKAAPTGAFDESAYDYVKGVEATHTINGVSYPIVISNGFAPALMTKPVYATPLIIDSNGQVVASGATEKYSIYDYCTERLSDAPTADQYELYTAMLKFGASVQEALVGSPAYTQDELDKYGYADAYYVANVTTKVDGVAVATETLRYREADVKLEAPKTYNGKIFSGFADADGNAFTMYGADKTASSWNYCNATLEIGANNFTYNYKTAGKIQTWTDANGNDLKLAGTGTVLTQPYANHDWMAIDTKNDSKLSLLVEDGGLLMYGPGAGDWRPVEILNKNNKVGEVGKTYVFETDFKLGDLAEGHKSGTIAYLSLTSSTDTGDNNLSFLLMPVSYLSSTTYTISLLDKTTNGSWTRIVPSLNFDQTYNFRIEYKITHIPTDDDASATGDVKIFIDGELCSSFSVAGQYGKTNNQLGGFGIVDYQYSLGAHSWYFDNTYIATED